MKKLQYFMTKKLASSRKSFPTLTTLLLPPLGT
uniref:Uncharacterized protein n=1 Tax=Nelumbo nucifera TaxID=4432 RepID=A0A822Y1V0_NELNU|nr:TPA_asm: hypothetical protein HUJ06_028059 [Nelumbo nucifera]